MLFIGVPLSWSANVSKMAINNLIEAVPECQPPAGMLYNELFSFSGTFFPGLRTFTAEDFIAEKTRTWMNIHCQPPCSNWILAGVELETFENHLKTLSGPYVEAAYHLVRDVGHIKLRPIKSKQLRSYIPRHREVLQEGTGENDYACKLGGWKGSECRREGLLKEAKYPELSLFIHIEASHNPHARFFRRIKNMFDDGTTKCTKEGCNFQVIEYEEYFGHHLNSSDPGHFVMRN